MTVVTSNNKGRSRYVLTYSLVKKGPTTAADGVVCWTKEIWFLAQGRKKAWERVKTELKRLRKKHEKQNGPDHEHDPGATWTITTNKDCLYMAVPKE